jgi:hypothetical protein
VLSVCTYCHSVVAKRGLDYTKLGKLAQLAEVPSPLRVGLRGAAYGGFRIVGRIQLDHGAGTWNEWYLALDSGRWLWLAEAQGRYYLTMPLGALPRLPAFDAIRLGQSFVLPVPEGEKQLVATEVHTARLVSAEGELPFEVMPGESVRYVDLSGPEESCGTLDYGSPASAEVQGFYGQLVRPDTLQIDPASFSAPPAHSAKAGKRMSCPKCNGALTLQAPDAAQRVTCPYCRALIDVSQEPLRALTTLKPPPDNLKPIFALGKTGKVRGRKYSVLGHLRREIVKSETGFWDEYLLWTGEPGDSAFAYLIHSGGHFTLAEPINYGDVKRDKKQLYYKGHILKPVEKCTTKVSYVSGEFPWAVEVGETVEAEDSAATGLLLSIETTLGHGAGVQKEVNASLGYYLDSDELWKGFGLSGSPPKKEYVAPHQPNPYEASWKRRKSILFYTTLIMLGLLGWSCARSGYYRQIFPLRSVPGVEPAAEHIFISDPFDLGQKGQKFAVQVELRTTVENSWVAADVSLVNDESGDLYTVPLEASYYHGYSDGESWSEGSRTVDAVIPSVLAGRYVARIEPAWPVIKTCSYSSDCDPEFVCESGNCVKHCFDPNSLAQSADPQVSSAMRAAIPTGIGGCGSGHICKNSQCVVGPVDMTVKLSYPTTRWGYAFWLWLLMALLPAWNFIRFRQFEQKRSEDNG